VLLLTKQWLSLRTWCLSEVVRVVDRKVAFGVSSDEGDEWPSTLKKIKACNILVIAALIWS
jgi:hypothetical protein